jgi:putative hemolysin
MHGIGVSSQVTLLILIILLLGCSAFFSGSETALMTVSRIRLRNASKKRTRSVKIVEGILVRPERLIGTILLGNNLVNVAMTAIATVLAIRWWGDNGVIYVTVFLTILLLIFAEITPKVYARYHSERISLITAPVLKGMMTILQPVTTAITWVVQKLLLLLDIDITKTKRMVMTEAEVKTAINIGWEDGSITAEEKEMLSKIFTLNDVSVADVMVPRKRMVTLRSDYTIDQALRTIKRNGYSRYPVRKGKSQEIIGFIHAKDLLGKKGHKKLNSMKKLIRPVYYILEDKKISAQLRHFKGRKLHQAIALSEKGDVTGLLTLEDILEEMVGSIEDEFDT